MAYFKTLREFFPDISLDAEDLLLLEAFQIQYLPDRAAKREFATLLHEYPLIHRFLELKCPSIVAFLDTLLKEHPQITAKDEVQRHCQKALWEIADLIIYNKHPDIYDRNTAIRWNISEISSIAPLEGKTLADVGAGSGRIAFLVAPFASTVFALEPITSFRSFMKEKAIKEGVNNLFVMDGTLDSMPLPDDSLDVLITSNAIGWHLKNELKEIERVVKSEGYAIHLLHADSEHTDSFREILTSPEWDYQFSQEQSGKTKKIRYYKKVSK